MIHYKIKKKVKITVRFLNCSSLILEFYLYVFDVGLSSEFVLKNQSEEYLSALRLL